MCCAEEWEKIQQEGGKTDVEGVAKPCAFDIYDNQLLRFVSRRTIFSRLLCLLLSRFLYYLAIRQLIESTFRVT